MRALLSVYDKGGLADLARGLADLGWELVASGNTAAALAEAGVAHTGVAEVTGSPEMLGGRVKTLHPKIHGGILADRDDPSHRADLAANQIEPIDLVVCNLYPFGSDPSVELIDIGGPAMVRAAAKNFAHVGVVTSPADYPVVLEELRRTIHLSEGTRRRLAAAAFAHTAAYDAAVTAWLEAGAGGTDDGGGAGSGDPVDRLLPPSLQLRLERAQVLRYGENPHQAGARYRLAGAHSWWDSVIQHAGRELSYLNIFDADAAWRLVHELAAATRPPAGGGAVGAAGGSAVGSDGGSAVGSAVAIIKHANPCGAAVAGDLPAAYQRALDCDPVSAFGGIVAIGGVVTAELAELVSAGPQADVVVAAGYEEEALATLTARRKATRLLSAPSPEPIDRQLRAIGNSLLVQEPDRILVPPSDWVVVTERQPTGPQWADLVTAWWVCARTTSNAVVVVHGGQAVGVGAGQQSRVVAAELAVGKAGDRAVGGAAASDAFFPFPDGLEVLAKAGVAAVAQPGGSVRDHEVVAAADAAGVAMVTTGERHFRH